LDCSWRYNHVAGVAKGQDEAAAYRRNGQTIDGAARRQIQIASGDRAMRPRDINCGEGEIDNPFKVMVGDARLCMFVATLLISKSLPLGYGYSLPSEEGSDPEPETVNLQTYGKKSGAVPLWNNAGK